MMCLPVLWRCRFGNEVNWFFVKFSVCVGREGTREREPSKPAQHGFFCVESIFDGDINLFIES